MQEVRERLTEFLDYKLLEGANSLIEPLCDDTSLLKSKLIDSLALLQLAAWIEEHVDAPLELSEVNPLEDWDTVGDVVNFVVTRRAS